MNVTVIYIRGLLVTWQDFEEALRYVVPNTWVSKSYGDRKASVSLDAIPGSDSQWYYWTEDPKADDDVEDSEDDNDDENDN